jgi:hypothetical protein
MAITFVQSRASASGSIDQSLAYTSNVTAGNLLLVLIRESGAQTADPVVTDSLGNTYAKTVESAAPQVSLFWAKSASSGANTVTVNSDNVSATRLSIHEFAGTFAADPNDQSGSNATAATSPAAGPSINPGGAALMFAAMGCASDVTFTSAGAGYTLGVIATANPGRLASAYQIVTGAGAVNAEFAWTGTSNGGYQLAASFVEDMTGPTITVQPANDVGIISNGQSTVYSATATGTDVLAPTWSVDGTPIADGGIYDIVTTGAGTASCSSTLTITRTDKTGTPFDIVANFEDDNGDTDTDTVTDTWWTGPSVTTFPATDGSGESTATLTSDYVTGVGEAIEVRIPLSDGDVAVTVTTT